MENIFNPGARVISATGEEIGVVEDRVNAGDDAASRMLLRNGDHIMEIPHDLIDRVRSTPDEVVLTSSFVADHDAHHTIEVRAEQAHIDVHEVELGRVVVDKTIERVPIRQDIEIGTDNVEVRRIPGGEEFDVVPEPRQEGDTFIIPVVEEVLVVTRRYRVIEEVHVIKHRDTHIEQVEDELRREVVTVREELGDGSVRDL